MDGDQNRSAKVISGPLQGPGEMGKSHLHRVGTAFDTDMKEDFGAVALNPNCTSESSEEVFKNSDFLFWVQPGNQYLFTMRVENHQVRAELGEFDGGRCGEVKNTEVSCMATGFLK